MRRYVLTGVGVVFAAAVASAQSRPAARFSAVQGLTDAELAEANRSVTTRGQAPGGPTGTPIGSPMPMPGSSVPLGKPTPVVGPGVTEQRGGVVSGPNVFGPGPVGTPYPTGVTYPVSGAYVPPPTLTGPGVEYAPPPVFGSVPGVELEDPLFGGCQPAAPVYAGGVGGATTAFNKWWTYGEYLYWWTKSPSLPTLLTTSSAGYNGILGTGDTRVLYPETSKSVGHPGFRAGIGYWFGTEQRWGAEGSAFYLGRNATTFLADTTQYPVLARPFVNLNQDIPFSQLIASPGLAVGSATITESIDLYGADVNIRRYLAKTNCARLDLLGGFKYVQLNEGVSVTERFTRTANSDTGIGVPTALSGTVIDSFETHNRFFGGQVGLQGEVRRGRWFGQATGKVAFGKVFQTSEISGSQDILFNDGSRGLVAGGLLAVPGANIGTASQDKFAVVPELGLNIGYHITPRWRVYVGYNFLYMSSVLRPGDQIDTGLDVTKIPNFPVANVTPLTGQVRPAVRLKDTDFFAQGVNIGLQFTW